MKTKDFKKDLLWRGLLKDIANEDSLNNILNQNGKFYIGIDPTSDSLHMGHYMTLILTKILNQYGLRPVLVLGGFTGMIGDPSGKNIERDIISSQKIQNNVKKIENQIIKLAKKMEIENLTFFNNLKVYKKMSIIDLYQKYGKLFNLNTMLSKDSVKNRIENGISYTEFSYQIFQAIDFLYLYDNMNVKLQLGGSDQWGNITAGTELIRKIHGNKVDVAGITINLLVDSNGNKIGKTQGNPMWLEKEKTSSYILFQYFINQTDLMSSKLLTQLTNITESEYNIIKSNHEKNPKKKLFQIEVAKRFISLIHSTSDYEKAKELSEILFKENYSEITKDQISNLRSLPSIKNEDLILMDLLIKSEKVESRRSYRELIANGSIKLNGNLIKDEKFKISNEFLLDKIIFISIGKKNKYLIWK